MKKKLFEIIASIDIGSNYIKMTIAQANKDGSIEVLDSLSSNTSIGRDAFTNGRVELSTIKDACECLNRFISVMKDYGVKKYRAVSTTGIRESQNKEYVIAQIKQMTSLDVEVLNIAQERYFIFKALRHDYRKSHQFWRKTCLIINISSGGIEVSVYEKGKLKFTEHIKLGALRIRETLSSLEGKTNNFAEIINQYFEYKTYMISSLIKKMNIDTVIGLGGDITLIEALAKKINPTGHEQGVISNQSIYGLYDKISKLSSEQVSDNFNVSIKQADILLPSLVIYNAFIEMAKCKRIYCPSVSLNNGIIYDQGDRIFRTSSYAESHSDIIGSVWHIAEKGGVISRHAQHVENLSLSIFDQTKSFHKLGIKYRVYLQIASILHDVGNSISLANHTVHSYNIINDQSIMGFSDSEMNIIASIAKYHSNLEPDMNDENYKIMVFKERIACSKLAAILKMAEALDFSHSRNIEEVKVNLSHDKLLFTIDALGPTILEEWEFDLKSKFFGEVMGIEPIIRRKI